MASKGASKKSSPPAGPAAAARPLLGAHMSIAGGVSEAIGRARTTGCECVQIFTKSSRQWFAKPYTGDEVEAFKVALGASGLKMVIAHDSYLLNLGAPDEALRKRSVGGLVDELERCELLGLPYLIAHPGAHVGSGEEVGIKTIAKSIDEAHQRCAGFATEVALEITAGQGSNLGYSFAQMGQIFDAVKENERLRLCFDTEHAFAAGYDLRDAEGYERTFAELDDQVGLERLVAFHVNDSLKPFHSRVDRHQHIGKGFIGLDAFRRLVNDPRFAGVPMCLETEPGPEMREIVADLECLRGLFQPAG
ncbi:MAG: deoxyribonuclease IV [Candidatus Binataceae bacterium]|nr:deoxyribonuclease IV [Candidatus Binataceae bacterium]